MSEGYNSWAFVLREACEEMPGVLHTVYEALVSLLGPLSLLASLLKLICAHLIL